MLARLARRVFLPCCNSAAPLCCWLLSLATFDGFRLLSHCSFVFFSLLFIGWTWPVFTGFYFLCLLRFSLVFTVFFLFLCVFFMFFFLLLCFLYGISIVISFLCDLLTVFISLFFIYFPFSCIFVMVFICFLQFSMDLFL